MRILGVGNRAVNAALAQAKVYQGSIATIPAGILLQPLIVYRVYDRLTGRGSFVQSVVIGIEVNTAVEDEYAALLDWQMLVKLNQIIDDHKLRRADDSESPGEVELVLKCTARATEILKDRLGTLGLPFARPEVEVLSILWPV